MKGNRAIIYIDGASRGNPGKAGVGVIIEEDGRRVAERSEYIGEATNNVAEYSALIIALEEALARNLKHVEIVTDSELLVRQMLGEYRVRDEKLRKLYDRARELAGVFEEIEFRKVARADNREADKLANRAINRYG